jgi:predicted ester cyclase
MVTETIREENKRIARRFIDEVSAKGNIDLIDELFAEDVIDHTPLGETRGREAIKELFENLSAAFSTHETTIENIVAEGDTVALRGPSTLTHEGEFMGIEPTGREVQIDGMNFLRIQDGKIVERWVQLDMLGMMQKLGVVELPGE